MRNDTNDDDDEKKKEGKQLKNQDMWDKNSDHLKDSPLFEIGIIDKHHIAYKNTDISKYAIENYEKVKNETNWWLPVKKQKGKNILWVLHEMLKKERKDQFFREIPINDAHKIYIWSFARRCSPTQDPSAARRVRGRARHGGVVVAARHWRRLPAPRRRRRCRRRRGP
jgi:hypothetical protein